jgi:hypothetical protein
MPVVRKDSMEQLNYSIATKPYLINIKNYASKNAVFYQQVKCGNTGSLCLFKLIYL